MNQGKKQAVEFIILHSTKYGDNSLVLHTLCREYGRRSFFLRSVSSPSSVAGDSIRRGGKGGSRAAVAGLVSPLNIIEAEACGSHVSGSAMMTVSGLAAAYPLGGLRGDLRKAGISLFIAEVLFRALREGAAEEGLYDWCVGKILLLDAMDGGFSNFHLLFLLELTAALGFRPEFADIAPFLDGASAPLAERLMCLPFEEAMLVPMTGSARSSLIESLLSYIEAHLEYPLNIRSLSVLRSLFQE